LWSLPPPLPQHLSDGSDWKDGEEAVLVVFVGIEGRTQSLWEHEMSKDAEEVGSAPCNPCPLCGSDRFTWGVAVGHYPFKFHPDNAGWLTKHTAIFGGQEIKARRCDSCGNIQLFVAPK
jgi:hypothetical protein